MLFSIIVILFYIGRFNIGMNVSRFLGDNLSFDENIKTETLTRPTRFLNGLGNFFLSPARHLVHGRSVRLVSVNVTDNGDSYFYSRIDNRVPKGLERFLKTLAAIVLLIPGTILGAICKGIALAKSPELRKRYEKLENLKEKEEYMIEAGAVAVALFKEDPNELLQILKDLNKQRRLDGFIKYFANGGNLAYKWQYPSLYKMRTLTSAEQAQQIRSTRGTLVTSTVRMELPKESHALACLLKLYAEGKIQPNKFFDVMTELNRHASTDFNEKARIQAVIQLDNGPTKGDDIATMTGKVEEYLRSKNVLPKLVSLS